MDAQESKKLIIPYINASLDDQLSMINFIMSAFVGPDVINDIPRQSASQRMTEGFPPYILSDLGISFVSPSQLESLYYYICRYAHPSLVLNPCLLHMYLNGNLPNSGILPLDLNAPPVHHTSFRIFRGIILIDKPNVSHVEPYDFERFRRLSRLPYLEFLLENFNLFHHDPWAVKVEEQMNLTNVITDDILNEYAAPLSPGNCQSQREKRRHMEPLQRMHPQSACPVENSGSPAPSPSPVVRNRLEEMTQELSGKREGKKMCVNESLTTAPPPFPSPVVSHSQEKETIQEMSASAHVLPRPSFITLTSNPAPGAEHLNISFTLTGSAIEGEFGPPLGHVDIGTSRKAYIIIMALPGIQKDKDQLSCDIETDGQVTITGTTKTSESVVVRHNRVFKMLTNNLPPPGPFKVSFKLPGPVDPRLCNFNFRTDGILEIVVCRFKKPRGKKI